RHRPPRRWAVTGHRAFAAAYGEKLGIAGLRYRRQTRSVSGQKNKQKKVKRFYKNVTVSEAPEGFRFLLDGKPVQTPARQAMVLPTRVVAEALAEEWRAQGEEMSPLSMPLTRMVNTVVDGVRSNRQETIAAILRFGENDLLPYRVETPSELARR